MPLDKHPEDSSAPNFGKPVFPEASPNPARAVNELPLDTRIGVQIELGKGADLSTALRNVTRAVGGTLGNK